MPQELSPKAESLRAAREAAQRLSEAQGAYREAIAAAAALGNSQVTIARALGITKQSVNELLTRHNSK